jgi:hypothetical protein
MEFLPCNDIWNQLEEPARILYFCSEREPASNREHATGPRGKSNPGDRIAAAGVAGPGLLIRFYLSATPY